MPLYLWFHLACFCCEQISMQTLGEAFARPLALPVSLSLFKSRFESFVPVLGYSLLNLV